jgi:hypothetical protein
VNPLSALGRVEVTAVAGDGVGEVRARREAR